MISGKRHKLMQKAARWPCGVCGRCVHSNSIQCTSCQKWVACPKWWSQRRRAIEALETRASPPPDSTATVINSLQNRVNSITLCITFNAKTGIQIIIMPKGKGQQPYNRCHRIAC